MTATLFNTLAAHILWFSL